MDQAYLFVHFKEKSTPDGEQVYFGVSKDGFHWEKINDGNPVLWCYYGDKGARDFTVTFCKTTGKYVILATDLSLAYGMRGQYHNKWEEISRNGSKCFSLWESEDLLHWTEQKLVKVGDEKFGCMWAPDIIYDKVQGDYLLHWSSSHAADDYETKAIYCCRTKDFEHFTAPKLLYRHPQGSVIDSAIYEENGFYYMFVKRDAADSRNVLLRAKQLEGPYEYVETFDESMAGLEEGVYEAPTAVRLEDGRWCLFLDYYGVPGEGQGYVPFIADSLESGRFVRADEQFSFPYKYKHGTILTITPEQYEALKKYYF
ncbi:MAG: glycoside hydrolase family 43 protein [Lachnospiraceae bacterium]|nr:glycoside hydrolase family 43 protein [Lachnospiraceae bacterium]